jgi:hypothetical protein
MAGKSISPDVKEPELLQFSLQSGRRDFKPRARETLPVDEDLLLPVFRKQVNQPRRVGGLTGGSAP